MMREAAGAPVGRRHENLVRQSRGQAAWEDSRSALTVQAIRTPTEQRGGKHCAGGSAEPTSSFLAWPQGCEGAIYLPPHSPDIWEPPLPASSQVLVLLDHRA